MKIVCDSCSTKYSISDDKVRGKVFKIRCKKCSHIIVVKGNAEEGEASPEAAPEAVWHVVIDGDQVGPLTDSDIRGRLSRAEITVENYVWKEGFADWQRLADVPDFADVAPSSVSGELHGDAGGGFSVGLAAADEVPEAAGHFGAPGSLFGGGGAHIDAAPDEATRVSPSGRTRGRPTEGAAPDAFSLPTLSAGPSEGADLFGMAAPFSQPDSGRVQNRGNGANSGRHDGGRIDNLTAQRSENSVLFSLSNLQSLAAPSAAIRPPSATTASEGSGLIDIRAMAASTMRSPSAPIGTSFSGGSNGSSEDDLPAFAAFSAAAPVLLPLPSNSGPPKWVYALIAVAALMVLAMGAAAFSVLRKPVMVEQVMAPPAPVAVAPPAAAKSDKGDEKLPSSKPMAENDLPPREGGDSSGSDKSGDRAGTKTKHSGSGKVAKKDRSDSKTSSSGSSSATATPSAPAEQAKAPKGSLDDLLDGALNPRSRNRPRVNDDGGGKSGGGAAAEPAAAGPLAKGAVVAGMNGVKAKVNDCFTQFKVPGMAMVNVTIGKNGKVSAASVTGKFAGTPTGVCVEKAVKTASFPPSDGLTTPYPFNLR